MTKNIFHAMSVCILGLTLLISATPFVAHAQLFQLVPCNGVTEPASGTTPAGKPCGFTDFVQLIKNLINILFTISIPITMIAFTWIGILLLTAGGNTSKISQAKEIASKVLIGFLIILGAWLFIFTVTSSFLNPAFNMFIKG